MKAEELRIGNLVNKSLRSGNGQTITDKIGCQDIVRIFEGIGHFNYEPVPLTEGWLLKFGFKLQGKDFTIGELNDLNNRELRLFESSELNICYIDYLHPIKSVHALQNLYFALTGKELTLNP